MRKFNGFTLMELMITLFIISILSALLLPMLSDNSPNRSKMMMKKAYYTITDVVQDMINDMSLYPEYGSEGKEYVGFDNTESVTYNGTTCSGNGKFPTIFTKKLNIDGGVSFENSNSRANFTTNDGMEWTVKSSKTSNVPSEVRSVEGSGSQMLQTITVDVNGSKKPNCEQGDGGDCSSKNSGFDRFTLYVTQSGKIVPKKGQKWFVNAIGVGSDLNGD